jgi:hypothetical protein
MSGRSVERSCSDATTKRTPTKLTLSKETLHALDARGLRAAAGGATAWSAVGHQPGVGNLGLSSYAICANN